MTGHLSSQLTHKKPVPYYVKRNDGEIISRSDLQYDLLRHIFSDQNSVFTDPNPALSGNSAGKKVTFRDLYVNTLIRSPRASKVLVSHTLIFFPSVVATPYTCKDDLMFRTVSEDGGRTRVCNGLCNACLIG